MPARVKEEARAPVVGPEEIPGKAVATDNKTTLIQSKINYLKEVILCQDLTEQVPQEPVL